MIMDIPNDWQRVTLRSVCKPTRIWNPLREPRDEFWYVDVSAVSRESLAICSPQRVKATQAPSRARKIIQTGDAIFATVRPTLRRIAFVEEQFNNQIASTAFCVVRADKQKAVPRFLYYALQTDFLNEEVAKFQSGASYPAVNDKDVLSQSISLPPKPEQEKISAVLWKVQRAIEVEEKLVAAARELKQSAMRQLFTHGLHNEPQKETEIGLIPKSWDMEQLAAMARVTMGQSPDGSSYNEIGKGVPLINGPVEFSSGPLGLTVETKFTTEPTKFCDPGDLILCVRGSTTGRTNVARSRACIGRGVAAIRARANQGFLNHYIVSVRDNIFSMGTGSTFPNISGEQVKQIKIPVPSPDEQKEIAGILQTIDRKISVHERKRRGLGDLFQTLLHQLMTAQIRVHRLDIDTSEVADT